MGNLTLTALRDNKYCRICLKTSEEMRPLFALNEETGETCSDILKNCASVQLQLDNRLPSQACLQCTEIIYKMHSFKKQCETSNEVLGEILSKSAGTQGDGHNVDLVIKSEESDGFESMDDDEISVEEVMLPMSNQDNFNISDVDVTDGTIAINSDELNFQHGEIQIKSEGENEEHCKSKQYFKKHQLERESGVTQSYPEDKVRKKKKRIRISSGNSDDDIVDTFHENNSPCTTANSRNAPTHKIGGFLTQISSSSATPGIENIRLKHVLRAVNKNTALLKTLMHSVEDIKGDINHLVQNKNKENMGATEVALQFKKCMTTQQLQSFDADLEDEEFFLAMVSKLTIIGGKDHIDSTRRLLGRILSNDVAKSFNWKGRNNKHSFQEYSNINKLVLATIRSNVNTKTTTQQEVEDIIKVWLRGAHDRDGGRTKRKLM